MENNLSEVRYDDRKKELIQLIKSEQDIKIDGEVIGNVTSERKAIFSEKGIKKVLGDLAMQRTKLEQTIKQLKNSLKEETKMDKELIELEKKIQLINNFNKNKQTKLQIETNEKDLQNARKDINDIKNAIGSRLKL